MKEINPRITCNDDTSLSVQASQYAYCTPRYDVGPYSEVEVGFIKGTDAPESFRPYTDGKFPSDVYGYVPIDVVLAFIAEHGGIKEGKMP